MVQRAFCMVLAAASVALGLVGAVWTGPALPAYASRQGADDLEVTGLPGNAAEYVRNDDLLKLPLVHETVDDDPDYKGVTMHVTGVYLDVLAKALGAPKEDDLIDAFCTDKYRSHYPAEYIATHRPIFVLQVDGVSPAAWAAKNHQYDPGPYFITYLHFVPSFHVLSHQDQPQVPSNVIRLNFSTTAKTYGAIAPVGSYPEGSPVQEGFTIAKQNCLRCHFVGPIGGTKSGETWMTLSRKARDHPEAFASYIHDPKQENPQAEMPGNPEYDDATRAALTAYFRTFSDPVPAGVSYPLRLKVIESDVTERHSVRPGWADVGDYVSGHGRAELILPSGSSRTMAFTYVQCPGAMRPSKDDVLVARWTTEGSELSVRVIAEGGFPTRWPRYSDCTAHVSADGEK